MEIIDNTQAQWEWEQHEMYQISRETEYIFSKDEIRCCFYSLYSAGLLSNKVRNELKSSLLCGGCEMKMKKKKEFLKLCLELVYLLLFSSSTLSTLIFEFQEQSIAMNKRCFFIFKIYVENFFRSTSKNLFQWKCTKIWRRWKKLNRFHERWECWKLRLYFLILKLIYIRDSCSVC